MLTHHLSLLYLARPFDVDCDQSSGGAMAARETLFKRFTLASSVCRVNLAARFRHH